MYNVLTGADLGGGGGGGGGGPGARAPPPPIHNSHGVARYSFFNNLSVFKRTLIAERSDRPCTTFVAHIVFIPNRVWFVVG